MNPKTLESLIKFLKKAVHKHKWVGEHYPSEEAVVFCDGECWCVECKYVREYSCINIR